ncbi:hypothetical protein BCD95_000405 [Clostridium beijerinckii]|uniref:Uncharacterized protein n=1 Tax=Clostridium beijerinckii TaxID=1520 RepID=A0AAE5LN69_CLOBE|nr:hypothetical protein [Clostridium beijerinckii]
MAYVGSGSDVVVPNGIDDVTKTSMGLKVF